MKKIFKVLSLTVVAWFLAFMAPAAAHEQQEPSWLVCSAPWQLAPALDRVNGDDPFQLLKLEASILTEGCLYRSFEDYPQRQIDENWMYYKDPLLFDIARVTVVNDVGHTVQYWAVTRTLHMSDLPGGVPDFVLQNADYTNQPSGAAGTFIRRFTPVLKHPRWDKQGS